MTMEWLGDNLWLAWLGLAFVLIATTIQKYVIERKAHYA